MFTNEKVKKSADGNSVDSDVDITDELKSTTIDSVRTVSVPMTASVDTPARIINTNRRKSSGESTAELATVKIEALNQLENTIKMADIIENKNVKITGLQTEIKSLKLELKQSRQSLVESKRINRELMDKVQSLSNINNRQRIELENLRTADLAKDMLHMPVISDKSCSRYVKDIIDNREQLLYENERLVKQIDEQHQKLKKLNSYIIQLEAGYNGDMSDYKFIDETTIDDRSKSDLLKIIRSQMDDKTVWMEYAIKLTREAVTNCPQLLSIDTKKMSEPEISVEENRWATFAISVLQKVGKSVPQLLMSIVQSADADQIKYLDTTAK